MQYIFVNMATPPGRVIWQIDGGLGLIIHLFIYQTGYIEEERIRFVPMN